MDTITRNHIFMENIDLINRTLRRHQPLLYALHLELDDVYQELALCSWRISLLGVFPPLLRTQ